MTPHKQEPPYSGLGPSDVLYMLFRHKWKILLCSMAGFGAAAAVHFLKAPVYESEAKLLVRYIVEKSSVDTVDSQAKQVNDSIINGEVAILTSWDLAEEVADAVTPKRLLPAAGDKATKTDAARAILEDLSVTPSKGSNVILVSYKNSDPELAGLVLEKLVSRYFDKHLEVHRDAGASEFVTQQVDFLWNRLKATEADLNKVKKDNNIISLADSMADLDARIRKCEDELDLANSDKQVLEARVKAMEAAPPPTEEKNDTPSTAVHSSKTVIQNYTALVQSLARLRDTQTDLLSKYTVEAPPVKINQQQIDSMDARVRDLEKKYPDLIVTGSLTQDATHAPPVLTLDSAKNRLLEVTAAAESLKQQLTALQADSAKISEAGTQIEQLELQKDVDEQNYRYFKSSGEKVRVDDTLDSTKIPNISEVQKPSPAMRVTGETKKLVMGLAGGGVGLGIAIALLFEMVLDRSVKRPLEIENRLRIPLLLSIPYFSKSARKQRLQLKSSTGENGHDNGGAIQKAPGRYGAAGDPNHFLRPFAEAIRDRLILLFQINNLTHKPKLVGVTGLSGGEGASALASSLAAALSETGDGKVLLVDMNPEHAQAHPFFNGKPALGLSDTLKANGTLPAVAENLYVATGTSENGGPVQLAPKRFYALMPEIKASHFDYVIFDMPPASQSSATLAMAGCLDKLLLVVEAGKTDRNDIKRAYNEFVAAKADVSCIVNKTRSPGPKWMVS